MTEDNFLVFKYGNLIHNERIIGGENYFSCTLMVVPAYLYDDGFKFQKCKSEFIGRDSK